MKIIHKQNWSTAAGVLNTNSKMKIEFSMPELYENKHITWTAFIFDQNINYDMIIGRDLLTLLKFEINFEELIVRWGDAIIPMKRLDSARNELFIQESESAEEMLDRVRKILDAKYVPANLDVEANKNTALDKTQCKQLRHLFEKYKSLFDGTVGTWKGEKYAIELKPDVKPYHAKAYPIPNSYEAVLKLEVERLCKIGVLKKVNRSEWAAPTFIIPKKDKTVRFITDL
jgi:hypothetical protein